MILPDFILKSRISLCLEETGLDSYKNCLDKTHFKSYPYKVVYNYNSRGFRDNEWPDNLVELKKSIWCFGDSFTVGLGSPISHTWVNILETRTNTRCINISLDGASNDWIYRKVKRVLDEIAPDIIIIQWSFISRSENLDQTMSDEARRQYITHNLSQQIYKLKSYIENIEKTKNKTRIIHSAIPGYTMLDRDFDRIWETCKGADWPKKPKPIYKEFQLLPDWVQKEFKQFVGKQKLKSILYESDSEDEIIYKVSKEIVSIGNWLDDIVVLDIARDGLHYDKLTANNVVQNIILKIDQ